VDIVHHWLVQQSEEARMNVNGRKTKEMMSGPVGK